MKISRYLVGFAKNVAVSRVAQIFFFVHLALLMTALIQKLTSQQTILPIHFEYDFLLYKILFVINLPSTVIVSILLLPFILLLIPVNIGVNSEGSHPLLIFAYVGWQMQWAIIGYWIEKLTNRWRGLN